jgi:hypothetical protein
MTYPDRCSAMRVMPAGDVLPTMGKMTKWAAFALI